MDFAGIPLVANSVWYRFFFSLWELKNNLAFWNNSKKKNPKRQYKDDTASFLS